MLTKKDFKDLAVRVGEACNYAMRQAPGPIGEDIAAIFLALILGFCYRQNKNFDRVKFLDAAGLTEFVEGEIAKLEKECEQLRQRISSEDEKGA